jgi:hypothetical protein
VITTTRRIARKPRACAGYCPPIQPGDVYLEHKIFPGHDTIDVPHPVTHAECASCATRYGRAALLQLGLQP